VKLKATNHLPASAKQMKGGSSMKNEKENILFEMENGNCPNQFIKTMPLHVCVTH
jgi:hypothetical protein